MLKGLLAGVALFLSTASMAFALNMNQASAEELAAGVKGVGPKLAQAIIEERERRRFTDAKDMTRVRGIGSKMADRIAQAGATFD